MRLLTLATFGLGAVGGAVGVSVAPWPAAAATVLAMLIAAMAIADMLDADRPAGDTP